MPDSNLIIKLAQIEGKACVVCVNRETDALDAYSLSEVLKLFGELIDDTEGLDSEDKTVMNIVHALLSQAVKKAAQ